jgi:hypothetical protein
MDTSRADRIAYDLLSIDTLHHVDEQFIHQYIVDTYTAQTATIETKEIALIFALVGLYLHVEHHYTGRQIQDAHMQLASGPHTWPKLVFPQYRGSITAAMVVREPHGSKRNAMIDLWAAAVWHAWQESHPVVKDLVHTRLEVV